MSKHGIRLPGALLDELNGKDYKDDERFKGHRPKRARNQPNRKDKRRERRQLKKQKRQRVETESKPQIGRATVAQPRRQKKEKIAPAPKQPAAPFSSDDELSSGDFDEFDEDDLSAGELEQLRELEEDESASEAESVSGSGSSDEEDDEEEEEEEEELDAAQTMERLRALKAGKGKKQQRSKETDEEEELDAAQTMERLRALKASKAKNQKRSEEFVEEEEFRGFDDEPEREDRKRNGVKSSNSRAPVLPEDLAAMKQDEMAMNYYGKKLGLKGKKRKLHAIDEFDAVGGLLEGLDFFENYGEEDQDSGDQEISPHSSGSESDHQESEDEDSDNAGSEAGLPFSSDDELSSGDFEDLGEEELEDESEEEFEPKKDKKKKEKENPYVAPSTGSYVPPSLRKKMLSETDSEETVQLKRSVRSSLNKLSESNIPIIVSALNEQYDLHARQYVTDAINSQIIEIITQHNKLLDTFIMTYASVIYALWRLRGVEVGASFVQEAVLSFLRLYDAQMKQLEDMGDVDVNTFSKQCSNLITLLAYSYNFGMVSSRLIYDCVRVFIGSPNEFTMELVLRVISVSGPLIRGDDPAALKEILAELLPKVNKVSQTPRMKFLLDTLLDLKNNRLKPSILAASHHGIKKVLTGALKSAAPADALQVSLSDIQQIETKGKWWLVGSSWKGNMENAFAEADTAKAEPAVKKRTIEISDTLLDDMPDWNEIARRQRMNTDVRRAIFISIMSAHDYMDAFTKLEKLNLKNKQSLEVPKVLLHCLSVDSAQNGYNPYYSLLGSKICQQHHAIAKSFQFLFWDIVRKFENDLESEDEEDPFQINDLDEEKTLRMLSNQACFFGYLMAEGQVKLDVLKHVSMMGLNSDGKLFLENLLCQFLLTSAKKAETKKKVGNTKEWSYRDDLLLGALSHGIQAENKKIICKSLRMFMKDFRFMNYIRGQPGSREYQRDMRRLEWAVQRFLELIDKELDITDL
ncbi:AaceriABR035Cp [[Ashbya] aceris (nom. inval.)]|nr:AaceriABR035Cp [[Ashbya] aceris (nom. inval.)]